MDIVEYLAKTAQIDIKDFIGLSVRGYIAESKLGLLFDFSYSLTVHSRKATIYVESLNQCCRSCSSHSRFPIGYFISLFIPAVSCAVIYMCAFLLHCQHLAGGTTLLQG